MAPDAEILDYRVFKEVKTGTSKDDEDTQYDADNLIAEAIDHAISERVDIINMSFGRGIEKGNETSPPSSYDGAIKRAVNEGIIIVCSSGEGDGDASTNEKL